MATKIYDTVTVSNIRNKEADLFGVKSFAPGTQTETNFLNMKEEEGYDFITVSTLWNILDSSLFYSVYYFSKQLKE